MSPNFIGRDTELDTLNSLFNRKISQLIAIKGRRRIGKSRLIKEFCKGKTLYRFIGLAPKQGLTAQDQREAFAQSLRRYWPDLPELKAADWTELFSLLAQRCRKGRLVICLDEISWMAQGDNTFLSKLKNAWDEEFKDNNQLLFILCGSVSSWIDKNILSSTGFVGRIHYVLTLKELPLSTCNQFWGEQKDQTSAYDK